MSNRSGKKQIAAALILAMLFTGMQPAAFAAVGSAKAGVVGVDEGDVQLSSTASQTEADDQASAEARQSLQGEEEIRVLVELSGNSILEEAVASGKDYAELSDSFTRKKSGELKKEQREVLREIRRADIDADTSELKHYDTVFNGVALSVREKDLDKLENISGVRQVYISQEFQRPMLKSSGEMIGADFVQNTLQYKGEGTVVAVIDSGLDAEHQAFRLDHADRAKLSKEEAQGIIAKKRMKGKYYSEKIPYGYNYYDHNQNLLDSYGVMHGMHVSGIVGANDAKGKIYGVAPNAQLLALKIFSDDLQYPTTFTDIWLKALDDAISLKADVINMSLGSPAGFSIEGRDYPELQIIDTAKKAGILIAIAAGNDGSITYGNTQGVKPLAENYDTALISNPALNEDSIAVASMENLKKQAYQLCWKPTKEDEQRDEITLHKAEGDPEVIEASYIDLKQGNGMEMSKSLTGKIALLEIPVKLDHFAALLETVAEKKPAALLLYNNSKQGDKIGSTLEIVGKAAAITVGRIKRSTYEKIDAKKYTEFNMKLKIYTEVTAMDSPVAGRMAESSAWGPTPDLRIKPEITAPGGNIYSTKEDGSYQNMSGTSMASPQVAGASAVVAQYIREKNIKVTHRAEFIKTLLMNTAIPIESPDSEGSTTPYFVRQQGAGAMNLKNALNSGVIVYATGTNDTTEDGKLELRAIEEKRFDAKLKLENYSDTDRHYYVYASALYEPIDDKGYRTQVPAHLYSAHQDNEQLEVTVKAHSSAMLDVPVSYEDAEALRLNDYLEGYIYLVGSSDEPDTVPLSIPFLGFYGDWGAQRAIDAFKIPEEHQQQRRVQFYVNPTSGASSSMFSTKQGVPLPLIDGTVYFSPDKNLCPEMVARIAPLRNMEEIEYSILDGESGEELRKLGVSKSVRKLHRLSVNQSYRMMIDSVWDGKLQGKPADEGRKYLYQIRAVLNNRGIGGSGEQLYRFPVRVDTKEPIFVEAPKIEEIEDTEALKDFGESAKRMKQLTVSVQDEGAGLADFYLQSYRLLKTGEGGIEHTKYEGSLRLSFTDETARDGRELPKIIDGKAEIPLSFLPKEYADNTQIFICRNGWDRNKAVELKVPFFAETSKLRLTAKDVLSNATSRTAETGESDALNMIVFLGYYNGLDKNGAEIWVNDQKLDKDRIMTEEGSARVRIVYPQGQHLSNLSVRQMKKHDPLVQSDVIQYNNTERYQFRSIPEKNAVEFTVDPLYAKLEVYTTLKAGPMPKVFEQKDISLDLAGIGLQNFAEIRKDNIPTEVTEKKPILNVRSGYVKLSCRYKEGGYKKVTRVVLQQSGREDELIRRSSFDIEEGKPGYYQWKGELSLCLPIEDNAKLLVYTEDMGITRLATADNAERAGEAELQSEQPEIEQQRYRKTASPSNAERSERPDHAGRASASDALYEDGQLLDGIVLNDLLADGESEKKEAETKKPKWEETDTLLPQFRTEEKNVHGKAHEKYPIIFIQTPGLLDVLSPLSTENHKIHVKGFVANLRDGDAIHSLELKLVDAYGNDSGEQVILGKEAFKAGMPNVGNLGKHIHGNIGYFFDAELTPKDFNMNIRAELETEKGEHWSIVRRLFYDDERPALSYQVAPRQLESEQVTIRLRSEDNSLKLWLYNGDSLIAAEDKTSKTLEKGGVAVEKEIAVPLVPGQNVIKLSAEDMVGQKTEEVIYIYRTEK